MQVCPPGLSPPCFVNIVASELCLQEVRGDRLSTLAGPMSSVENSTGGSMRPLCFLMISTCCLCAWGKRQGVKTPLATNALGRIAVCLL
jgi:hypothetical protein